ncbi:MAG: hypothetical protein JST19_23210 [Bacteroidetes bacterium]|nr:hypothetical protein [Bacteroidota bacterium]
MDINMPSMDGWELLERFDEFPVRIKEQFVIYILSVSLHPADMYRARNHPLVADFLRKPLSRAVLEKLFYR